MKKSILLSGLALATFTAMAQTTITDTVSMGAGYANNVWYSLENDEQGSAPIDNWDIALVPSGSPSNPLITSIFLNPKKGAANLSLYAVPGSTRADFSTIDTTGLSTWTALYNSDTSWALGAFNQTAAGHPDYGWGSYTASHNIEGNKIFIIKYSTGGMGAPVTNEYKKLYIDLKTVAEEYTIVYDDLDNSDSTSTTFSFTNDKSKNFIYFSLTDKQKVDREPEAAKWDLLFTQYVSSSEPYGSTQALNQTVGGILHNAGVEVAQANNVKQDDYVDYDAETFSSHINTIGFDWKDLDYAAMPPAWIIEDSVVYFVKSVDKDIWKVVLTGFDGTTSGSFIFNKTLLYEYVEPNDNVNDINGNIASVALYPNPAAGQQVTLIYSFNNEVSDARVILSDMAGRMVRNESLNTVNGLHQHTISTSGLNAGIYIVNLVTDKGNTQQKLIVQ